MHRTGNAHETTVEIGRGNTGKGKPQTGNATPLANLTKMTPLRIKPKLPEPVTALKPTGQSLLISLNSGPQPADIKRLAGSRPTPGQNARQHKKTETPAHLAAAGAAGDPPPISLTPSSSLSAYALSAFAVSAA